MFNVLYCNYEHYYKSLQSLKVILFAHDFGGYNPVHKLSLVNNILLLQIIIQNPTQPHPLSIIFMVLNLPNLDSMFTTHSYTELFMLTILWNIGVYGMIVFGIFVIFLCLKLYHLHMEKQARWTRQSLITRESQSNQSQYSNRESAQQIKDSEQQLDLNNKTTSKFTFFDFVNIVTSFTFYLTLIVIAILYLGVYAFGELGHGTGHDILAVVIMVSVVTLPTIIWKNQTKTKRFRGLKKQVIFTIVMLAIWLGVSIFSVIALKGVCLCQFTNKYGKDIDGFQFSTEFTRSLTLNKICPDGGICHIYATLAENASDSVFINVHTGSDINNLTVLLQAPTQQNGQSRQLFNLTNSSPFKMQDFEQIGKRNVFFFYFNDLKPDTLYTVIVKDTRTDAILNRTSYRTLPGQNAEQLRLAIGGDVGISTDASTLTSNLVQFNPHVLILGGDNTYDDGMRTCFYSWDTLYDMMDELNGKLDRIVPLIMSIGNHDVGYHALASVKIDFNDIQDIPYYFIFNPQHTLLGKNQVPEIKERLSYHYHILGPTVHAHLDSGYIVNFQSQRLFIEKVIRDFPNHYKFANYHNPIYPSCTDSAQGSNDRLVIEEGLKNWTPLFDSGKFIAAFEHHTHHKKFTKKIRGDKVSTSDGVRYVGDGSYGVPQDPCPAHQDTPRPDYFQYYEKEHPNHIWKIKLLKTTDKTYSIQYKILNLNNTKDFEAVDHLI